MTVETPSVVIVGEFSRPTYVTAREAIEKLNVVEHRRHNPNGSTQDRLTFLQNNKHLFKDVSIWEREVDACLNALL